MKTFILDGYNVIYKMPEMKRRLGESLEAARTALAVYLSGWRRRYPDAEVCIVFDGKDNEFSSGHTTGIAGIGCSFTRSNETADERIIALIRNAQNSRNITVITEDNSVRNSSLAYGAEVKKVDYLLPRGRKKEETPKGMDKVTPPVNASRVTAYYEDYLREAGKI